VIANVDQKLGVRGASKPAEQGKQHSRRLNETRIGSDFNGVHHNPSSKLNPGMERFDNIASQIRQQLPFRSDSVEATKPTQLVNRSRYDLVAMTTRSEHSPAASVKVNPRKDQEAAVR
jgi:hypothetical protein